MKKWKKINELILLHQMLLGLSLHQGYRGSGKLKTLVSFSGVARVSAAQSRSLIEWHLPKNFYLLPPNLFWKPLFLFNYGSFLTNFQVQTQFCCPDHPMPPLLHHWLASAPMK